MSENDNSDRLYSIDLDRSRAPRAYRDTNNLWRNDIQRIHRLIDRQVKILEDVEHQRKLDGRRESSRGDTRPHLSVAIFGPSGSGKSSLIRTLVDDVQRSSGKIMDKDLDPKVASLPVMDPTTWARTDQFLYAFLAAALEEERQHQEHREDGYPQGLSPVQLAFQEVNEYLRVVDEPESLEEHDPLGLSLQKLERHTSGLRLRKALGELIEQLAKEFRAEVILLPVDDLDMAPDHLVDALQSYQSFLNHPRLIPVFTFTDRMPEELIEVHYRRTMEGASGQGHPGSITRLSISEQMSVQFLARCFPVRNRIRLGPAPARVQRALYSSSSLPGVNGKDKREDQVLELLIQSSFLLFGHPDGEDAHKVRAALRPSTLRRQFQVVDAMADCRLWALRTPQFGVMAGLTEGKDLLEIARLHRDGTAQGDESKVRPRLITKATPVKKAWKIWGEDPKGHKLSKLWTQQLEFPEEKSAYDGYTVLAKSLRELGIGATWTAIFNGACWSLLNVHRDTLRELGLFLEDLYSWTPKELRSVVLENILAQDQVTRRTVVDRWFNRTDYRRSQVLSLLAANVFRPWMDGEEPYGDEEAPVRRQLELEKDMKGGAENPLDRGPKEGEKDSAYRKKQIQKRLTIPAPKGLLWFLNVTLGFYLPQIMARNWGDTLLQGAPVKSRMSGNGWDLHHAATNAARIADARQDIFSFGMLFLDPTAHRRALEIPQQSKDSDWYKKMGTDAKGSDEVMRRHILLRIWTCCGYSSGRYWSAISLWRGLSFIGQVIELGLKHEDKEGQLNGKALKDDLEWLTRTHITQGMMPGSLLNRNSNDQKLLQGFPKWEPRTGELPKAVGALVDDLIGWLKHCWSDCIFPLPAGDVWVGWGDCFIRRIHGEYILGSLWPSLNAAYMEEYPRNPAWAQLGKNRTGTMQEAEPLDWKAISSPSKGHGGKGKQEQKKEKEGEKYRWSASLAAEAWSDILFEYWRGCPPMLKMLLSCPVMVKSQTHFADAKLGGVLDNGDGGNTEEDDPWLDRLEIPKEVWEGLTDSRGTKPDQSETAAKGSQSAAEGEGDKGEISCAGLVTCEFAIPRVKAEDFTVPTEHHHAVRFEDTELKVSKPTEDPEGQFKTIYRAQVGPESEDTNTDFGE